MKRFLALLLTLTMIISAFVVVPTTVNAAEDYRAWSQKDSRWSSIRLGSSPYTIGSDGCLVSSITKLIIQAGFRSADSFNIGTLANWLNSNGGYTSGGLLYWAKPSACVSGFNYYGKLLNNGTYNSTSYNGQLVSWVNSGYHITLQVSNGNHWIAIDEAKTKATGEVYIMDSSYDVRADLTLSSRYGTFNSAVAYTGGTSPNLGPSFTPVDIGTNFYAIILNSHYWKPIENNNYNVVLGTENHTRKQLWKFERQNDLSYKIISLFDNEVIDLNNYGSANGTNIGMCVSTDSSAQRWYITNNNGAYCFIPKCSPNGAMDINNNDSTDGTNIHYWAYHGKDSQTFSIYRIDDIAQYLSVDIGSNFTALILNSHYWKPIENRDHNVVLSTEDYSKKQLWRFERQSDKSYKIISLLDDEVIDLKDFGNANGTNIGMCVSTDSSAQRWYMTYNNGAHCLIPKCSQDGAMDINNNDSDDGTNIHYWYFHGKDSQTFSIYKINDVNEYLNSHTDPTSIPTETTEFLGDVDGDGTISIIDATCIQRHLASIPTASYNEKAADADGDGSLSIVDATTIQRWLAQLLTNENIGKPIA